MLTLISTTNGVASITIDVDGDMYPWFVGSLAGVKDIPTHLATNADVYRQDIRTALSMGRVLTPVPVPTLEEIKAAKQAEITSGAQTILAPLAKQYCGLEMQTWDQQATEAAALTANPASPIPLLSAISAARGMGIADLASRILANDTAWKTISGHVIGQRLAYQDRLDAITDQTPEAVEAIQAITVAYTLP